MHQEGSTSAGKEADMVSLEQFRQIVLDDQGASHGPNIHHPFKVRPSICQRRGWPRAHAL